MRKFVILGAITLFFSCQKPEKIAIEKLNGYWEITEVTTPDHDPKKYTINETFDFFEVRDSSGTRSKVKPQFDGTFISNDQSEQFTVVMAAENTYLNYATPYAKWKEQIVTLQDSVLVLQNEQQKQFHYRKTGPLNFTGDGKTVK